MQDVHHQCILADAWNMERWQNFAPLAPTGLRPALLEFVVHGVATLFGVVGI